MKTNELPKPPRQKTSVVIEGLDTSTPDDLVKDGKCETLHNLRYKEGAWRPVHPHKVNHRLNEELSAELEIVYHHPAAGEDTYIAYYKDEPETFALISLPQEGEPIVTPFATVRDVVNISHFGNVLIFETANSVFYYLLVNGEYKRVTFPPYARMRVSSLNAVSPTPTSFWAEYSDPLKIESYPYSLKKVEEVIANGGDIIEYITEIADFETGESLLPIPENTASWRGEILLFSTWQLEDGTNTSPSPLLLIHSSRKPNILIGDGYSVGVNDDKILQLSNRKGSLTSNLTYKTNILSSIRPTIEIRIAKNWNYSVAKTLVIWATRINPTFEGGIPTDPVEEKKALERFWFADNDLANQPFYKLAEISIDQFEDDPEYDDTIVPDDPTQNPDDGVVDDEEDGIVDDGYDPGEGWDPGYDDWDPGYDDDWGGYALSASARSATTGGDLIYTLSLSRQTLEAIVANEVYVPNNNSHLLFASNPFDYNNQFHYFNYKQVLSKGYHISDSNNPYDAGAARTFHEWVELSANDQLYDIVSSSSKNGLTLLEGTPLYNIISYPDIRAKRYSVEEHFQVSLLPAPANGFAWYKESPTKYDKFPPIKLDTRVLTGDELPKDNSVALFNNKIQVTSANNLFSIPFDYNYSVGSRHNKILAMQSAAIEMHEMKVGELPLYVFTEEGIFALVAGSNTLYSSVAAINYDKIINPNTLAINGAIVYITEKGVHLLTSAGTQVISQPIHDANGMPPIDFLRRCKIVWPKQYNEIVLLDEESTTGKAYVYNLDAGYWSTRTLQGVKLNTDELYNNNTIYNLADEDEQGTIDAEIVTRPIKLGNVEFKRLETIIPRMQMGNCDWIMQIKGAVSPDDYRLLRSVNDSMVTRLPVIIRRTPFSAKYFKVAFEKLRHDGVFAISHIDFEWYARFLHRMR